MPNPGCISLYSPPQAAAREQRKTYLGDASDGLYIAAQIRKQLNVGPVARHRRGGAAHARHDARQAGCGAELQDGALCEQRGGMEIGRAHV